MSIQSASEPARRIYTVTELNRLIGDLLEQSLPRIWLEAEVSNLRRPGAHWYFSLKDADAQLRCAMFRGANIHVRPVPKDGDQVLVRGKIALYGARGDLQMIVEHMEPAGEGALRQQFEALKARLQAEGLFDEAHKRPLPALPRRIGVITSATGAALQDMLSTWQRRYRMAEILLYPAPVQGDTAAAALTKAVQRFPHSADLDVLILARGGGSLEDLWPFNDEALARAIRACPVPVVSGVGHEIDFSIADFAADRRAPTPTAAAELVAPDQAELGLAVDSLRHRLHRQHLQNHQRGAMHWQQLSQRLERLHPQRRVQQDWQRLDELRERLQRAWFAGLRAQQIRQRTAQQQLMSLRPQRGLQAQTVRLQQWQQRLLSGWHAQLQHQKNRLRYQQAQLRSYSAEATLQRGCALVSDEHGQLVRSAEKLSAGQRLQLRLARGTAEVTVNAGAKKSGAP